MCSVAFGLGAMAATSAAPAFPVWLFVPNLIGYVRIVTGLAALAYAFDAARWPWFAALYFLSYALDAVDGVAARALRQTSRFGAVLDMVTDRCCTAALLAVLAHAYPASAHLFLFLLVLDIGSHWVQMYRWGWYSMGSYCMGWYCVGWMARHTSGDNDSRTAR